MWQRKNTDYKWLIGIGLLIVLCNGCAAQKEPTKGPINEIKSDVLPVVNMEVERNDVEYIGREPDWLDAYDYGGDDPCGVITINGIEVDTCGK